MVASSSPSRLRSFAVAVVALATVRATAAFKPTFTGDVVVDFPIGPGVFQAVDAVGDVASNFPTGWDITDVRFAYDLASDTAYFGECKEQQLWLWSWLCCPFAVPASINLPVRCDAVLRWLIIRCEQRRVHLRRRGL
jgi:hypothetical protein